MRMQAWRSDVAILDEDLHSLLDQAGPVSATCSWWRSTGAGQQEQLGIPCSPMYVPLHRPRRRRGDA
jgi:hypothetical protein